MLIVNRGVLPGSQLDDVRQQLLHADIGRLDHVDAEVVWQNVWHQDGYAELEAPQRKLSLDKLAKRNGGMEIYQVCEPVARD